MTSTMDLTSALHICGVDEFSQSRCFLHCLYGSSTSPLKSVLGDPEAVQHTIREDSSYSL
eukprot:6463042-Amphidinium_carterae.2